MTRLPAKVLIVHRLGDQYLITVQISEKHRCAFGGLRFGEKSHTSLRIAMVGLILSIIKIPASKRESHSRSGSLVEFTVI